LFFRFSYTWLLSPSVVAKLFSWTRSKKNICRTAEYLFFQFFIMSCFFYTLFGRLGNAIESNESIVNVAEANTKCK